LGVAQNVHNHQTESGIKDSYTQHWIDLLIVRARDIRKQSPGRTTTDIQAELMMWVNENKSDIYNPFLTLDGKHLDMWPYTSYLIFGC
jgi:hypothetical protein